MRFSHFFVDRPIFAAVISIVITLIGGIAYFALPVAQYPEVAPPTVVVSASYPGASAEVVAETVATPLEQQINGVEDMLYMVSQSTGDGNVQITITFALGTDLDEAQVLVQNRVTIAEPQLPDEVRRRGITTKKNSPDLMMVIHLNSPDGSLDQLYISNYATLQIKDVLARLHGVGDIQVFGARDYSMRIWLNPERMAELDLTTTDVVNAVEGQNIQVASGSLNQLPVPDPGAFQLSIETLGRLQDVRQFENIIVKTDPDGRITRVGDIARVELGAQDYLRNAYLDDRTATALGIFQLPGSNALATAAEVKRTMEELRKGFPAGLDYDIIYNPTEFIQQSVDEVVKTIFEAVALVVIVVILFLQTWRAAIIPIVAIPVSLIGTFAVMSALGFSLNNLSLFGLVLAIGIVVDDAIVVVENVERNLRQGLSPSGGGAQDHGRGRRRLARHRPRALGRVHPGGADLRHPGPILPSVRRHHRGLDTDLVPGLAHPFARPVRASAQAARGAPEALAADRTDPLVLQRLQLALRPALPRLWRPDPPAGPAQRADPRPLWRADRPRRPSVPAGADRLHPRAGPGLPDHRDPAAAGLLHGADRQGRPRGHQAGALGRGHGPHRGLRRLRRCHLHQRAERGRHLRHAQAVRGAGRQGHHQRTTS